MYYNVSTLAGENDSSSRLCMTFPACPDYSFQMILPQLWVVSLYMCNAAAAIVVQMLSCVWFFATPWTVARQAPLSITNSQSLLKLMSIASVMPSNHLILCHPLLLPPSVFPSIRVFPVDLVLCIRWPKYWSFSFNISPSNEYSGLISSKIDGFDILTIQRTLKSLLQHHNL